MPAATESGTARARAVRRALGPTVLVALAGGLHRAIWPRVLDVDGFYHLKHTWVYRTRGLLEAAFPWTQFSAIRREAADLWYGFHVLLLPLTGYQDLSTGVRVGAFGVTAAALLLVHAAFALLGLRRPLAWTLLFAFATPTVLFRLLMLRPHPISLGLFLLLFALLLPRSDERSGRTAAIAAASALVSWLHLSLAWIPVAIAAAVALARRVGGRALRGTSSIAVLAGLLAGLLLRPNPLGAARLAWIQVGELLAAKHLPLRLGAELLPFAGADFVRELVPLSLLLLLGVALFALLLARGEAPRESQLRCAAPAALALSAVFLALTFTTARRSCELFVAFAVVFVGLAGSAWLDAGAPLRRSRPVLGGMALALLAVLFALVATPLRVRGFVETAGPHPDLRHVADWLRENARPGEIVFHVRWEEFAELFFWNERNTYINGMDPIFEYDYDPALYWKHHHLAADGATASTCGALRCGPDDAEDTHRVLAEDFQASYVLVEPYQYPALYDYLLADPGFEKCYGSRSGRPMRLPSGEAAVAMRGESLFRVLGAAGEAERGCVGYGAETPMRSPKTAPK